MGVSVGLFFPALCYLLVDWLIKMFPVIGKPDLFYIGCIAVNVYTMQYFFKQNKDNIARGILAATFLCAFIFFFYKVM